MLRSKPIADRFAVDIICTKDLFQYRNLRMEKPYPSAPSQGQAAAWHLLWKGNGLACEFLQ